MPNYITTEGQKIYGERVLCTYLVRFHSEACHEADTERLAELCQRFGIIEYIEPPQPAPTEEDIAANKKDLIAAIAAAAQRAVESEANAALQIQMWEKYKAPNPHPYVVANINWGKSIYLAAEQRKAMVEAGVSDDHATLTDFSSFGPKPYTVYQLYSVGVVEL